MPKKTNKDQSTDVVPTEKPETIMVNGMPLSEAVVKAMPNGAEIWAQGQAAKIANAEREQIRTAIKRKVGDPESLLGTTADGAQLAVAALLVDVIALDSAKTFADYKAARLSLMAELVGPDRKTGKPVNVAALAQDVIAKIKSGDVRLTAVIKGVPAVLAEVMERSTKVVAILSGAAK